MASYDKETHVTIKYTNHRGETQDRNIRPQNIEYGVSQWHRKPQWILHAWDIDKNAQRSFAMVDIQQWTPHIEEDKTSG